MLLSSPRARALTLIELTVVLLILAATAGILIPRLTGYGERAHGATAASTIQECNKALALFEANRGRLPDRWDNLVEATGGGLPLSLVETGVTPTLSAGTLASLAEAEALAAVGITTVYSFDSAAPGFNATFQPYQGGATPTPTPLASGTPVAVLPTPALGFPATSKLVVLGLGAQNELFGVAATNVPLVFEGSIDPSAVYLRYVGVFEVADAQGPREKARLVGILKIEPADGTVVGADEHLRVYYESRAQ